MPAPKNAWEKRQALSLKEIRGRVVKGLKHVQINNSKDAIESQSKVSARGKETAQIQILVAVIAYLQLR